MIRYSYFYYENVLNFKIIRMRVCVCVFYRVNVLGIYMHIRNNLNYRNDRDLKKNKIKNTTKFQIDFRSEHINRLNNIR